METVIWCPQAWEEHLPALRRAARTAHRVWTPDRLGAAAQVVELLDAAREAPLRVWVPAVASLATSSFARAVATLGELAATGSEVRSLASPGGRIDLVALGVEALAGETALRSASARSGFEARRARGEPHPLAIPGRRTPGSGRKPNATYEQVKAWAVTQATVSGSAIEAEFHVTDHVAKTYMERLEAEGIIVIEHRFRPARVVAEHRRRKPSKSKLAAGRKTRARQSNAPRSPRPRPVPPALEDIRDELAGRARQARAERAAAQCPPHPQARVSKGFCGACGRQVGGEQVA